MKILNNNKDKKLEQIEALLAEVKVSANTIDNVDTEGLQSLLGEIVTVFCASWIYTGKLVGVNNTCIKLENPSIVYETGAFTEKNWKDAQKLPHKFFYVQTGMIESFGILK